MAVDANVLIFERFKEEIQAGKTLRAAVNSGFSRAFTTILDSRQLTTLMAAAVLFSLGTGPIKGFAVTLALGVLISMFTAVTVTNSSWAPSSATTSSHEPGLVRCPGISTRKDKGEAAR